MSKKLELTNARRKIISDAYAEYLQVGLCTAPADFAQAEESISKLYEHIGKKRPHFVNLSSPLAAELYINLLTKTWPGKYDLGQLRDQLWGQLGGQLGDQLWDQLWGQLGGQLGDQLRDQLWDQLWDQLRDQLWGQLGGQLRDQLWGQLRGQLRDQLGGQLAESKLQFTGTWFYGSWDYYWMWLESGRRVGATYSDKQNEMLDLHIQISRSCGWWYSFNDFCIITDRPEAIIFDDQYRLHCETGPAIRYRDQTGLHSWHGTRVPPQWINNKQSLTAKIALTWKNVEQRRAACEIVGWNNILNELQAKTIDQDPDPQVGELLEVMIPDIGKEKILRVRCGTGRMFALPVPPDMETALQANCWTYAIPENVLQYLEFRT